MKFLLVISSLFLSLSAFSQPAGNGETGPGNSSVSAHVDILVGTYKAVGAEAVITKRLISPATLFDAAKYQYFVELETDKYQFAVESRLSLSADGKSLSTDTDSECDDPGCTYYTDIRISVTKKSGKPVMEVYVAGFTYDEDGKEDKEVEGTIKLAKIK